MLKGLFHFLAVAVLTVLTQLGGLAWLVSLAFRRRVLAFVLAYVGLSVMAYWTAPMFGRQALPCLPSGPLAMQSVFYCALNRYYAAPALVDTLGEVADAVQAAYPGARLQVLDAGFPFFDGFPLLPHLSHDDGRKADLALFYARDGRYLPGATRSPIGYFAFEQGPTTCRRAWPTLRWDLDWLQGLWRDLDLDEVGMRHMLQALVADPRVGRVLIEPHLRDRLGVASDKLRFQGCRAARHDDHLHVELAPGA